MIPPPALPKAEFRKPSISIPLVVLSSFEYGWRTTGGGDLFDSRQ
jgi:hypothetical protein